MSFGYSTGDFFTATSLIVQAGPALREASGSAQEYRQLNLYLSTVQRVLGELDKLEPVEGLAVTVNAIEATALTCQYPLREFLETIEHYRPSLELGNSVGLIRDTEKKLRWRATKKAQAAERLQAQLAGYMGSINMLMGLYQMWIFTPSKDQYLSIPSKVNFRRCDIPVKTKLLSVNFELGPFQICWKFSDP